MKKDVLISIQGRQDYQGTDPDRLELVTPGKLERTGEEYLISYEESELTGLAGTMTQLFVSPTRVTLRRTGTVRSEMVFEPHRRHLSLYSTPYGNMEIGIVARKMNSTITDNGGFLEINYDIEIDHALAGQNLFSINVRSIDGGVSS